MKRPLLFVLLTLVLGIGCLGMTQTTAAGVPYPSFSLDIWGRRISCPPPYEPIHLLDGSDIRVEDSWSISGYAIMPLSQPQGLAVDQRDHLFIADSGNNRIVEYDADFQFLRTIGDSAGPGRLSKPRGVFVHDDGFIYVADTGNNRIAVFSHAGEFVKSYERPNSPVFGVNYRFAPISLAVDRRGTLYVVTEGGYRGLVTISEEGNFLGFFGGNEAGFDAMWVFKRLVFSEEQLRREARRLPGSPSSVAVDQRGLIYTSTTGTNIGQIKRFNLGGTNTLPVTDYGDPVLRVGRSMFSGIVVDEQGIITAVDANSGQVFQYSPSGDLLFVFGWRGAAMLERMGIVNQASGIGIRSDGLLLVSDARGNNIHVYQPTEFAVLVHRAVSLFEDGRYQESEQYWNEVLRRNASYDLAHRGLGMAAYQREDWETAMTHFELAKDGDGYSDAFWWARRAWLLEHFSTVLIVLVILWVSMSIAKRIWRLYHPKQPGRRDWSEIHPFLGDIQHIFRVIIHPTDGFYEIRWENKGSPSVACFLLLLVFAVRIMSLYKTSLIFTTVDKSRVSIFEQAMVFFIPFFLWVIANYLISSLKSGEGRFRDIFIGSAYSLAPYILIGAPLVLLSNGLTQYEASIYHFFQTSSLIWCGILLYFTIQTVHNYDVWEAIPSCIMTIFTMVVLGAIGALVIGLTYNTAEFFQVMYKEVIYRVF